MNRIKKNIVKFFLTYLGCSFIIIGSSQELGECLGNCEDGTGYWKDISGYTYKGDFKLGQVSGYGKLTYSFNDTNRKVGKMVTYYTNANTYDGFLNNGRPEGKGELIFNDKVKWVGFFKNGELIEGEKHYPGELILVGEFEKGVLKSPGVIKYSNGSKYEGEIVNNVPNGQGTMTYPTGNKNSGFWKMGKFLTGSTINTNDIIYFNKIGDSYTIDVMINDILVKDMIFDTGAEYISLSSSYIPALIENGAIDESDILGNLNFRNADGSINSEVVINLKKITIGNVTLSNIKASVCEDCKYKGINLLGMNAIKQLGNIYIDFSKNRIILNRYID